MGIRKNFRILTARERQEFVEALFAAKKEGVIDEFAAIHETHFNMNIHRSSHFLPWHREMLLRFEHALQAHHPDVSIPYWNSSVDTQTSGGLWDNSFLGQFDGVWNLNRKLGSDNLPTTAQVEENGQRKRYPLFWPELESTIHNPPHRWVGGRMDSTSSPLDPAFYLHHCWIDLLWAQWQARFPNAEFVASTAGAGLHDPLMEWPDRTPADVLDHQSLGYIYDYEVPPRWESLGGVAIGDPGAVLQTGGRLVVFHRGTDNAIYHRWQKTRNGDWADLEWLGAPPGAATSGPAAALNAPGGLVAFARGADNAIWHAWQDHPDGNWW
jgi:tyrosinase